MRILRLITIQSVLLLILASFPAHSSEPRIDGSTEASFDYSYAQLVESLSPEDRLRLSLAQLVVLQPLGCLTSTAMPNQPFLTETLGGKAVVRTCRKKLHGLTFQDIIDRADFATAPESGGSAGMPPNNSFKPTPLRGTAQFRR